MIVAKNARGDAATPQPQEVVLTPMGLYSKNLGTSTSARWRVVLVRIFLFAVATALVSFQGLQLHRIQLQYEEQNQPSVCNRHQREVWEESSSTGDKHHEMAANSSLGLEHWRKQENEMESTVTQRHVERENSQERGKSSRNGLSAVGRREEPLDPSRKKAQGPQNTDKPKDQNRRTAGQETPKDNPANATHGSGTKTSHELNLSVPSTEIRSWGCARRETPLIFVHIGKAGGGNVRARMAASARDYNRSAWHRVGDDRSYYYPIYSNTNCRHDNGTTIRANPVMYKGHFATSTHPTHMPPMWSGFRTYEGTVPCAATTPLGQALACPLPSEQCQNTKNSHDSSRCDLVYVGHNLLGNELHWLPTQYLLNWWKGTPWFSAASNQTSNDNMPGHNHEQFYRAMAMRDRHDRRLLFGTEQHTQGRSNVNSTECPPRALNGREYKRLYSKCLQPKEAPIDGKATFIIFPNHIGTGKPHLNWGPVYASLPVLRVTMVREPFSWLVSKFFWHQSFWARTADHRVVPYRGEGKRRKQILAAQKKNEEPLPYVKCDDIDEVAAGWSVFHVRLYILYMCGEHCLAASADLDNPLTLEQMEEQAAYNLRNSFAVVGLLHKTDQFYDMIARRVDYMDPKLNPDVVGKNHASSNEEEVQRCRKVYQEAEFQNRVLQKAPLMATLHRLYQIAVEVNEYQYEELQQCEVQQSV